MMLLSLALHLAAGAPQATAFQAPSTIHPASFRFGSRSSSWGRHNKVEKAPAPLSAIALPIGASIPSSPFNVTEATPAAVSSAVVSVPSGAMVDGTFALPPALVKQQAERAAKRQEQIVLMKRAAITAVSCMNTWLLVQLGGMSIVRACGLHAMVASLVLKNQAYSSASLAGSFCGMTGLMDTWMDALMVGTLGGGMLYWWESGDKIHAGKGGRLGTMGVLAHVLYFVLRGKLPQLLGIVASSVARMQPQTTAGLLTAAAVLHWSRKNPASKTNKVATWASKASIVCFLLSRTLQVASPMQHVESIVATFACSWIVRAATPLLVFPVGVTCFLASFCHLIKDALMFDVAMGSFVGTTRLPKYSKFQLLQASVVATLLFYSGIFLKVGGRMGLFSFLGVGFGL